MHWECPCGAFAAEVDISRGTRAVCYCQSCREFAHRTQIEKELDEAGGLDLFQVAPEEFHILKGAENLTWMRLTPKGPLRWYTTCCNSPVAHTLDTRAIPFVTLPSRGFPDTDALGPVDVRVFRRFATTRAPDGGKGQAFLYSAFARRVLKSLLTGGWKQNPFFNAAGKPVATGQTFHD